LVKVVPASISVPSGMVTSWTKPAISHSGEGRLTWPGVSVGERVTVGELRLGGTTIRVGVGVDERSWEVNSVRRA
jgi:hypothetical protein